MNAPAPRGRPRGGGVPGGAKRGAKPGSSSVHNSPGPGSPQFLPSTSSSGEAGTSSASLLQGGTISARPAYGSYPTLASALAQSGYQPAASGSYAPGTPNYTPSSSYTPASAYASTSYSLPTGLIGLSGAPIVPAGAPPPSARVPGSALDEDGEGDDEMFPAMADDDYSEQLSWQSQSRDNLKVLMENLTPVQYERFEAYRRAALSKQSVRKVIQQTVGAQVSVQVAQIVAGFSKVFVGEMVEKARAVQERRGETGPLSPDHLREAYRMYQEETGRVGAARPMKSKRLFVR
ncbi:hTAFII28-like protein conserved region-domain-containing protein [Mycena belliarum]|uniref:Transcription initiation factor TFIID subunit 11 n=1 Tax=Mycena belliarum TaxID=1033014 RepID=A0AAD6UHY4_9AGAR|nr:hTAFII28-like protein conserved region-domain-containing protein [Mycena belliae]